MACCPHPAFALIKEEGLRAIGMEPTGSRRRSQSCLKNHIQSSVIQSEQRAGCMHQPSPRQLRLQFETPDPPKVAKVKCKPIEARHFPCRSIHLLDRGSNRSSELSPNGSAVTVQCRHRTTGRFSVCPPDGRCWHVDRAARRVNGYSTKLRVRG